MMKLVGRLFIAIRVYVDATLLTNVGRVRLGGWGGAEARRDARIADIFDITPVATPWGMSVVTAVFNGKPHPGRLIEKNLWNY